MLSKQHGDAAEPAGVDGADELNNDCLPSYARPTRASLGHSKRGARASTGSLTSTSSRTAACRPQQQQLGVCTAATAAADAGVRRASSRKSTACVTMRTTLESIYEVPGATAAVKRPAHSSLHYKSSKLSSSNAPEAAAHRDSASGRDDQMGHSQRSSRARASLPSTLFPSRSTAASAAAPPAASRQTAAVRAGPCGSSRTQPLSAHNARVSSASATGTASSGGRASTGGSRAVSAPRLGRTDGTHAAAAASAAKGRKSITPRSAQGAAGAPADHAGSNSRRCPAVRPSSSSARGAGAPAAGTSSASASAAVASAGGKPSAAEKASVVAAAATGLSNRNNSSRASLVRSSRDSTANGSRHTATGAGAAAAPARPSRSARPSPQPSPKGTAAVTVTATAAAGTDNGDAAAVGATAAAPAGVAAWDVDESYVDMLPAACGVNSGGNAQHAAAAPASSSSRHPADLQGSSTPADAPPAAAAPGISYAGGSFTPSVLHGAGAGSSTPYGCTPLPAAMLMQARGCKPGMTPVATPGGLEGHFTAMVTPGGPSWPQGMPAGGLVPYSITPPAGGRTVARTAVPQPCATPAVDGLEASRLARSRSSTPPATTVGPAGRSNSSVGGGELLGVSRGAAAGAVIARSRSSTPPAATVFPAGRSNSSSGGLVGLGQGAAAAAGVGVTGRSRSSTPPAVAEGPAGRSSSCSGQVGAEGQGAALAPGGIVVGRSRSVTPGSDAEGGCGASSEPGSSRSRTPGRTPQSAAKHAALAAQLQSLELTWGQYKETSGGRASITSSPARARSAPRGSTLRSSSIGGATAAAAAAAAGVRSSLSYSRSRGDLPELSRPTANAAALPADRGAAQGVRAEAAAAGRGDSKQQQGGASALMEQLKAAAAAAEAAWFASQSWQDTDEDAAAAAVSPDRPAAAVAVPAPATAGPPVPASPAAAGARADSPAGKFEDLDDAGVSSMHPQTGSSKGSTPAGTNTGSRGSSSAAAGRSSSGSGSAATPVSARRPLTRGAAGAKTPGRTPKAASSHVAAAAGGGAVDGDSQPTGKQLAGTKRQTPSRTAAPAAAATPPALNSSNASAALAPSAAAGSAAAAGSSPSGTASAAAAVGGWSAGVALWAAPSPSASPSGLTAKRTSRRTAGRTTPLRHSSAAKQKPSACASAAAAAGDFAGAFGSPELPFGLESSPAAGGFGAAAEGGGIAGVDAATPAATPGCGVASAGAPGSPSAIDTSGDIDQVAARLADFSIQQYTLSHPQDSQLDSCSSPDTAAEAAATAGSAETAEDRTAAAWQQTPVAEGGQRGSIPAPPTAIQTSWMAFAARRGATPSSRSPANRVRTPPRFRLSGVGVGPGTGSTGGSGRSGLVGTAASGADRTSGSSGGSGRVALVGPLQGSTPASVGTASSGGGSAGMKGGHSSIPRAPLVVAAPPVAGPADGRSGSGSGSTTPSGSESEQFYSPLQNTPGSSGKTASRLPRLAAAAAATSAGVGLDAAAAAVVAGSPIGAAAGAASPGDVAPSSVERLSHKYAALSLIPRAPGSVTPAVPAAAFAATAAAAPAAAAAAAAAGGPVIAGTGDDAALAFFTPVEGLIQQGASVGSTGGFSSAARLQSLATVQRAVGGAAGDAAAADGGGVMSSAAKRRRVAALAAVAAAFDSNDAGGGSNSQAEAEAAANAAVAAALAAAKGGTAAGGGGGSDAIVVKASLAGGQQKQQQKQARVSKQLLGLFETAAGEAGGEEETDTQPAAQAPPAPAAAAAVTPPAAGVLGAAGAPASAGGSAAASSSSLHASERPFRRLSGGASRTPVLPAGTDAAAVAAAAAAGSAGTRAAPAAAAAAPTAAQTVERAALGSRAAFFDVPEVGTPLFPPHTPAATPLRTGFGALSARKLSHIGSGARRVTTTARAGRNQQQHQQQQQEQQAFHHGEATGHKADLAATRAAAAAATAAAAAALHSRIGRGHPPTPAEVPGACAADGNMRMTRGAPSATPAATPPAAAAPAAAAAAQAIAAARQQRAGAAAAAAAAAGGEGPGGPCDTLEAAAAAAAAGFDVGFRPSPGFKPSHNAFPAPAGTPAAAAAGALVTPGPVFVIDSPDSFDGFTSGSDATASTEQRRPMQHAPAAACSTAKRSGGGVNSSNGGGGSGGGSGSRSSKMLSKARQFLRSAMPRGGSGGKAASKAAAGAAAADAAAAGGASRPSWHVAEGGDGTPLAFSQQLSQQQSYDDGRGPGAGDQAGKGTYMPAHTTAWAASLTPKGHTAAVPAKQTGGGAATAAGPAAAAAAGGGGAAVGVGPWGAADSLLPIEAMSDTSFITTRSRRR